MTDNGLQPDFNLLSKVLYVLHLTDGVLSLKYLGRLEENVVDMLVPDMGPTAISLLLHSPDKANAIETYSLITSNRSSQWVVFRPGMM